MNKVECIIGTVRSGKTTELINKLVNEYSEDDSYRSIFITCEEPVDWITKRIARIDSVRSFEDVEKRDYLIFECKDKDSLETVMAREIMQNNCRFYIDMPELYMEHFAVTANVLVDTVPNEDCPYEMDITWVRSKNNRFRSKGGSF